MEDARLIHNFTYHPPDEDTAVLHDTVRGVIRNCAITVSRMLPEGRERSLALTKLEEAMFWANASIARDVPVDVP